MNLDDQRLLYLDWKSTRKESRSHGVEVEPDEIPFSVSSHTHGANYFSRRIEPQSSSILGSILSHTRAALNPHFPAHSAPNRDEETWVIQSHTDEPRWDASDMHMAYGAPNNMGILPPSNVTTRSVNRIRPNSK